MVEEGEDVGLGVTGPRVWRRERREGSADSDLEGSRFEDEGGIAVVC